MARPLRIECEGALYHITAHFPAADGRLSGNAADFFCDCAPSAEERCEEDSREKAE